MVAFQYRIFKSTNVNRTFYSFYWYNLKLRRQFLTEGSIYLVVPTVPYRRIYLPCGSNSFLQKDLSTLWFQQFLTEGSIYLVVPTVPYRRIYLPCGSNSSLQKDLSTLWFQQFLTEESIYLVVPTVPYRRIYVPCGSNST